jgi:hypothetical protein
VVAAEPGLYFVGLKFLYAPSSSTLLGVGRDAGHVTDRIIERRRVGAPVCGAAPGVTSEDTRSGDLGGSRSIPSLITEPI